MAGYPVYEQGRRAGDWIQVAEIVENQKKTAIVHDLKDGRWEAWRDGHCVFGSATSLREAQQALER